MTKVSEASDVNDVKASELETIAHHPQIWGCRGVSASRNSLCLSKCPLRKQLLKGPGAGHFQPIDAGVPKPSSKRIIKYLDTLCDYYAPSLWAICDEARQFSLKRLIPDGTETKPRID